MQVNSLLLDTHIWIWLMNGDTSLSKKSRDLIAEAHQNATLYVSAISIWEVAMLEKNHRIILKKPCIEWVKKSLQQGLQLQELTPEIAVESCQLPGNFHADPADRIIVATARVASLALITCDKNILTYAKQKLVTVVKG